MLFRSVAGIDGVGLEIGYSKLEMYTQYTYTKYTPSNVTNSSVESFIISHLNNDNPVMFLNIMEGYLSGANTHYLNDNQNFDNHWMVITKYYKDNNTGERFIAFATWGKRISINLDLLRYTDKWGNYGGFYPDFYVYEIHPK